MEAIFVLRRSKIVSVFLSLLLLSIALTLAAPPAKAVSTSIVISQVYGGGGNSGATYKNDFIELLNLGTASVDVTGWTVQYASSSGTSWTNKTSLSGTISPGHYYLIQEAAGTGCSGSPCGAELPTLPDLPGGSINISSASGKVALVSNGTTLTGSCPTGGSIVDFFGFGAANCFEGAGAAPTLSNITADFRGIKGCSDTDNNTADFAAAAPDPRNSASPTVDCSLPVLTINNVSLDEGNSGTTTFTFSISLSAPAGTGGVTFDIATADGTASALGDYTAQPLSAQTIPADGSSTTFDVLVNGDTTPETNETFFVNVTNVIGANVGDGQGQGTIQNDDIAPNLTVNDVSLIEGNSGTTTFSFTVSLSAPAGTGGVTFDIATADGTATAPSDYTARSLSAQTIPAGGSSYTFDVTVNGDTTFEPNETFSVNVPSATNAIVTDGQGLGTITNDDLLYIHDVQGVPGTHTSPYNGQNVTLYPAVVTAIRSTGSSKGFWLESPDADWDTSTDTSEGIFVYTGSAPTVNVGDSVIVSGKVQEYSYTGDLALTELGSPLTITASTPALAMPSAVVVGTDGRIPPTTVIENDGFSSFDPSQDGIDFWESLEGMRVQLNNPQAVGPTKTFSSSHTQEIPLVGDSGANATIMTPRGGIIIRGSPSDMNPERIILQIPDTTPLLVNVGAKLGPAALHGVIDYNYSNFKLWATDAVTVLSNDLQRTAATAQGTNQLAIATFNVENLAPTDPESKFNTLAGQIVNNLKSPDILAVEEIQDNNGTTDNGTVDASTTWGMLTSAIQTAGGPSYLYRQIDPVNNADGGAPGGNIRVGFLFRTDHVSFIDRPGGGSSTGTSVVSDASGVHLSYSPGRIDPTNSAWSTPAGTRRSLAGEFMFNGHHLFVIANHLKSKGEDNPLFGSVQPAVLTTESQRTLQAQLVHDFVDDIVALDPNADVVVLGDMNDFQFSTPLVALKGAILNDLIETRLENERYTYVYDGNSEALDHILVSNHLFNSRPFVYQPLHINAEFYDQASDHDPQVVTFTLNDPPTAEAHGPYSVSEGASVQLNGTGSDPENGTLTYAWDLDNNGTFETSGATPSVSATNIAGPTTRTVTLQVTDDGGLTATSTATINILNVAPSITSVTNNGPIVAGASATISVSASDPGGTGDTLKYAFDCNNDTTYEIGPQSGNSASCSFASVGTFTVNARVTDSEALSVTGSTSVVVNNPIPTLTSISPMSAQAGGPAFTLTVSGTNFINGSVVRWNGSNLTTSFVSGTRLTATVPASNILNVGTANVTVFNPTPGGGTSSAQTFAIGLTNTSLQLTASSSSITVGQPVTLTAALTQVYSAQARARAPQNVTPSGTITFTLDSTTNITRPAGANGVTTYMTNTLTVGTHTVTAKYSGDTNLVSATSAPVSVLVNSIKTFFPFFGRGSASP